MAKDSYIRVRMTDKDREIIEDAAKIRKMSLSEFVRDQLVMTSKMMVKLKEKEISEQSFIDYENVRVSELTSSATADD